MQYQLFSDKGDRELNEDYFGMIQRDQHYLFVLADGLGGHGRGEVASRMVVESVVHYYMEQNDIPDIGDCIEYAQQQLLMRQELEHDKDGMKTTLVILEVADGMARWVHIGDSRLYMFNSNKVVKRTLDHSVPQMLVESGEITENDIRGHEDRNRLLRVMGVEWNYSTYEISDWISLENCQAFLLCTDGFWEQIEDEDMERLLETSQSAEDWIEDMVELVRENGADADMDNFTAIAVGITVDDKTVVNSKDKMINGEDSYDKSRDL